MDFGLGALLEGLGCLIAVLFVVVLFLAASLVLVLIP